MSALYLLEMFLHFPRVNSNKNKIEKVKVYCKMLSIKG